MAILLWPAWAPTSSAVGLPAVAAVTSLIVPVFAPEGSCAKDGIAIAINNKSINGTKIFINEDF